MTDVSVIIPAKGEGCRLEHTLDSIDEQQFVGAVEVIVVACGDATIEVAKRHAVVDCALEETEPASTGTATDATERGPGQARNRGVRTATGNILLFTDADTVVPPTWIQDHYRHYLTPSVVGVGGPLEPLGCQLRHRLCFRVLSDWWYRVSWPVGFVQQPGPNCSVRRSAFEKVDGFDESLPFLEDTDLSLRLRSAGVLVYDRTCPVRTATRRQRRVGYLGLFITYLFGYLAYFCPGLSPADSYF
ncbi:glycosyltransferase [Natrialbaceae archaeon A-chndr2]